MVPTTWQEFAFYAFQGFGVVLAGTCLGFVIRWLYRRWWGKPESNAILKGDYGAIDAEDVESVGSSTLHEGTVSGKARFKAIRMWRRKRGA